MDLWTDRRTNAPTNGRTDQRINRRKDQLTNQQTFSPCYEGASKHPKVMEKRQRAHMALIYAIELHASICTIKKGAMNMQDESCGCPIIVLCLLYMAGNGPEYEETVHSGWR